MAGLGVGWGFDAAAFGDAGHGAAALQIHRTGLRRVLGGGGGQFSCPPSQPGQIYRALGASTGCFPAALLPTERLPRKNLNNSYG